MRREQRSRRLHAQVARAGCTRWPPPRTSSLLPLIPLQGSPLPEELLAGELRGSPGFAGNRQITILVPSSPPTNDLGKFLTLPEPPFPHL